MLTMLKHQKEIIMPQDNFESVSISSAVIETIIGAQTRFTGNVKTSKPIRIDGEYEGEIESTDSVVITETGSFKGTISCASLILSGKGEGTATCSELLDIKSGASFKGDVATKNIVTYPGSMLDGNCKMIRE